MLTCSNYKSENGILFSKNGDTLILYPAGKTDTSYSIPDSVTSIGSYAFSDCSNLTSVTYNGTSEPENSGSVFVNCSKLTSVNVPTNYEGDTFCGMPVNKIGEPVNPDKPGNQDKGNCGENVKYTFDGETLTISGSGKMSDYSSVSYVPWNDYKDSIKSVVIEGGVQSIGRFAFIDCSGLHSVTIPDSVKSIGDYSFFNCSSLTSVTYNGISEPKISDSAFNGCNKLTSVNVPTNYEGDTFCGKPVNKPNTPDKPVDPDIPVNPNKPSKPSNTGKKGKKAGIIAGLVVVGIIAVNLPRSLF